MIGFIRTSQTLNRISVEGQKPVLFPITTLEVHIQMANEGKKLILAFGQKQCHFFPELPLFRISQLCGAFFISIWNIFWILFNKFQKMKIQFIFRMRKKNPEPESTLDIHIFSLASLKKKIPKSTFFLELSRCSELPQNVHRYLKVWT